MKYPVIRDLDGVYFRVERNGRYENTLLFLQLAQKRQIKRKQEVIMTLPGGKTQIPEDEGERLSKIVAEFAKVAKDFGVRRSVKAPDEPKTPEPILFPSPEMERLRMMLDYNGLEWADKSDNKIPEMTVERTHLYFGDTLCSIIHGYGTYGGYNLFTERDEGLLELMCEKVNGGEPIGELTADDVITILLEIQSKQ